MTIPNGRKNIAIDVSDVGKTMPQTTYEQVMTIANGRKTYSH